jgi:hypothetical protein
MAVTGDITMTDQLTKTFFDTFGIEPKLDCKRCGAMNFALGQCAEVDCQKTYPQITDRILLELICIVLNTFQTFEVYRIMDIDSLKEKILKLLMLAKVEVYSQVRTLFEVEQ